MAGTLLNIRDETLSGESLHEWSLEVMTERITVRELIRSRVYQEVQDHNLKQGPIFRGLVGPLCIEGCRQTPTVFVFPSRSG